jgi:hypothetical protein
MHSNVGEDHVPYPRVLTTLRGSDGISESEATRCGTGPDQMEKYQMHHGTRRVMMRTLR